MYSFIPILIALVISTGNIITGSISQKLIIFLISFIGGLVKNLIIPILLVSVAIGIVGGFSEKVQLNKLSKYLKSFIFWFFGIVLTLFVTSITLEGTLSSSVDGITAKTAKAAVSSLIPVVGKILGDATDTVIGSMFVLKNAFGIIGIVIIILVAIKPVLDLIISMALFYLLSAVTEIIAEEKIVKIINIIAESYKALFAILISVIILFLIGITLIIKISNNGMMYR